MNASCAHCRECNNTEGASEHERPVPVRVFCVHSNKTYITELLCSDCKNIASDYHTISHVWGRPNEEISCVTYNTEWNIKVSDPDCITYAARAVKDHMGHFMWMDTVCINQDSIQHKEMEVKLMGKYYSLSSICHVMLHNVQHVKICDVLTSNTYITLAKYGEEWLQNGSLVYIRDNIDTSSVPDIDTVCEAIVEFVSNPWFRRVWTFQELHLPEHRVWHLTDGRTAINDDVYKQIVCIVKTIKLNSGIKWHNHPAFIDIDTICPWHEITFRKLNKSASEVLDCITRRCCNDVLDRIYGCIGMLSYSTMVNVKYCIHPERAVLELYKAAITAGDYNLLLHNCEKSSIPYATYVPKLDDKHFCTKYYRPRFKFFYESITCEADTSIVYTEVGLRCAAKDLGKINVKVSIKSDEWPMYTGITALTHIISQMQDGEYTLVNCMLSDEGDSKNLVFMKLRAITGTDATSYACSINKCSPDKKEKLESWVDNTIQWMAAIMVAAIDISNIHICNTNVGQSVIVVAHAVENNFTLVDIGLKTDKGQQVPIVCNKLNNGTFVKEGFTYPITLLNHSILSEYILLQ